ncbi:hypothetical protein MVEN_00029100 [Mycena venus]|uniref:Uncharacterized protein n=1 Tax=Mycena venus TaxID=2733690 RepID=A0A8H7DHM7_9AGAR|nr:hypothetical protein MVEN_00029100 [Mycena venus]
MILSLDHHHQKGPTTFAALAQDTTAGSHPRDDLLTHCRHLETLLDSALATLTLIHGYTSTPVYTPHLLGVLHVLSHHITQPSPVPTPASPSRTAPATKTSTTTSTTTPTNAPKIDPTPATYAAIAESWCSEPSLTPHCDAIKRDSVPPSGRTTRLRPSPGRPAHVVIRFDMEPEKPLKASPITLYSAITKSLADCASGAALISGVQWSRKGNLVLRPDPGTCTARLLASQSEKIWATIRPLLGLSEKYACPEFDTGSQWHSVVFHGVPMPSSRRAAALTVDMVHAGLVLSGASQGHLQDFSVLCRPDDFQTRDSLALRVSLSSEADATQLIKNGGFMAGTWCRVSPYMERSSVSPSPPPS